MTKQTTITIPVPTELAEIYNQASPEDKYKIEVWVRMLLRDIADPDPNKLKRVMDEISDQAQANGLTPEILEEILADDE